MKVHVEIERTANSLYQGNGADHRTRARMGIAPTGKRVEIRYMDFWKVVDNWVMVDFPHVMRQLGVDPFGGHGWEKFDSASLPVRAGDEDSAER